MKIVAKITGLTKRLLRFTLTLSFALVLGGVLFAAWLYYDLPDVSALSDRSASFTIEVRDWQGETHPFKVGPANPYWVPLEGVPVELKWAVIAAEDASFYLHKGVDVQATRDALVDGLKKRRLERGASTITQQLAKNLYLTREKTLLRKIRELLIAVQMEKQLTKGRILELYLNIVEIGPLVYGVGHGASYLFDAPVASLTPAQSTFMAAILPGPRVAFNPETRPVNVRKRAARLVSLLGVRNVLDEEEMVAALIELGHFGGQRPYRPVLVAPGTAMIEAAAMARDTGLTADMDLSAEVSEIDETDLVVEEVLNDDNADEAGTRDKDVSREREKAPDEEVSR